MLLRKAESIEKVQNAANKTQVPLKKRKIEFCSNNSRKKSFPVSIDLTTPVKKSKNAFIATPTTSPRKTRAFKHKEEIGGDGSNCKCEYCGLARPLSDLRSCSYCSAIFHFGCMGMESETLEFFEKNLKKWRCPRCISCIKCDEYIYEPENLQCLKCGKVFCKKCRPKNSTVPNFPYNNWYCNCCIGKGSLSPGKIINKLPAKNGTLKKKLDAETNLLTIKNNNMPIINDKTSSFQITVEEKQKLENMRNWSKEELRNENNIDLICSILDMSSSQIISLKKMLNLNEIKPNKLARKSTNNEVLKRKSDQKAQTSFAKNLFMNKSSEDKLLNLHEWVYLGPYIRLKPIYESSYPEPIQFKATIYICEFCLRPMINLFEFKNHVKFCPWKHPPGNEIYRENNINIWEIEGQTETMYCRNLCLLAKLFLSSKTLYHEVETFTFYVLTEITPRGCFLAGYFSKEKNPSKNNNLSCLLTLPSSQAKGYGKLLIDLSYNLSKREHKIGSPEHPLSDMGLMAYRSYWKSVIISETRKRRNQHSVYIKDLSVETGIHTCDIISTLLAYGILLFKNDSFHIDTNVAFNIPISSFRRRTIHPELLCWRPEYNVNSNNKMNSYSAD